jgi:hypothetical protein
MNLDPLWNVLKNEEEIDLFEAIEKAKLPEDETIKEITNLLTLFTKQWEWCGFKTFTNKGFQKKVKELALSELFGYIELLHKCRDTPPRDPSKGGGLPVWFDKLESGTSVKPNHPTYQNLVEWRYGRLP